MNIRLGGLRIPTNIKTQQTERTSRTGNTGDAGHVKPSVFSKMTKAFNQAATRVGSAPRKLVRGVENLFSKLTSVHPKETKTKSEVSSPVPRGATSINDLRAAAAALNREKIPENVNGVLNTLNEKGTLTTETLAKLVQPSSSGGKQDFLRAAVTNMSGMPDAKDILSLKFESTTLQQWASGSTNQSSALNAMTDAKREEFREFIVNVFTAIKDSEYDFKTAAAKLKDPASSPLTTADNTPPPVPPRTDLPPKDPEQVLSAQQRFDAEKAPSLPPRPAQPEAEKKLQGDGRPVPAPRASKQRPTPLPRTAIDKPPVPPRAESRAVAAAEQSDATQPTGREISPRIAEQMSNFEPKPKT